MAQSALTVTPPNPTPPTNMSCTGATPPNVPNYTRGSYADWLDNTKFDTAAPPLTDDGVAGALITFAANTAALASGTSAADNAGGTATAGAGGTGINNAAGTYPGATSGLVPASSSIPHESVGSVLTIPPATGAPAFRTYDYPDSQGTLTLDQHVTAGVVATQATRDAGPNASHASSLSPITPPALTSIASRASGTGTIDCVATGTNFTKQSVLWVNGIAYPTTFTSATSITAPAVPKRATAGTLPVYVITGGVISTATVNWTFT